MSLSVCILNSDVLRPNLIPRYHSYGRMFERLLSEQSFQPVQCRVFDVMEGEYPDDDLSFDAYLVTGSKADSFATDPWIERLKAFLHDRYVRGDKLLGICFGHQLLAIVLDGMAERASQGWGIGVHRYRLLESPSWMPPSSSTLDLLASHQDQVTRLPKGATLIASSDFCPNAVYRIGDQVLCFQGHPEFTTDYARELLNLLRPVVGETRYQTALPTLDQPHQGVLVAEWMMRFIADRH